MFRNGTNAVVQGRTVLAHSGMQGGQSVPEPTIGERLERIIYQQQTAEDMRLVKDAIARGLITPTGVQAQNLVFALTLLHEDDFVAQYFPRVASRPTNNYGEGEA